MHPSQHFLQPSRSASQPYTQIRVLLHRKRKSEFPLKPDGNLAHDFPWCAPLIARIYGLAHLIHPLGPEFLFL
jgi:hypothetical protein